MDAGRSVLLSEADGPADNPAIEDPGRMWELWTLPENYAFLTEPQQHADGTRMFAAQDRGPTLFRCSPTAK
ncbi:hypothetical protein OK074_5319 [Actinobacteria bacterium OK074]|nr:hypothetical protein OK074_5319 [Actinobacteria bacterium OK074]